MFSPEEEKQLFELSKTILGDAPVTSVAARIDELRDVIRYHEWKYYIQNDPVVSDYEYDQLYKMLEALEADYPDLVTPESPTQRVSSDLTEEFPTVNHIVPMLSLDNSYNKEDLEKFDQQVKKLTGEEQVAYAVEPKYDGGSIALVYEADRLVRAATRGNGIAGEEMTPNARAIRSVPVSAGFSERGIQTAELRGEAVIRKDRFKALNQQREKEGLPILANARNSASGALRTKDPKETARRNIEVFIFQLAYAVDADGKDQLPNLENHSVAIELLAKLGFKVSADERKVCQDIGEVLEFCEYWQEKRDTYGYEIDGMVIKVNNFRLHELCGATSHHPRWAIAYKFKARQATTRLLNVEYQIGKIGSITPVAKLEPVQLAGVTVSSVSLHNEDFIINKDIRLGDMVLVERAGDVIPYIVKPLTDLRDGNEIKIDFPKKCPSCDTPLVREEDEAAWRCPNYQCEAQVLQRLIFHISRDAMDIDGFGYKYLIRFYELGWIKTMADIYRLDYDAIAELEGFGKKSAEKLRDSIDKAKDNAVSRLLHSLSIHHLGKRASKLIAERIDHVLDLAGWTVDDYVAIPDIGPVVAENVHAYFSKEEHLAVLREMEELGVNLTQTEEDKPLEVAEDAPLSGKTILFTGSLETMTRKEAQELAAKAGAKNISAVSGNLDILVAGEKAGSKLTKAQELGTVQILTEEEFLGLVQ